MGLKNSDCITVAFTGGGTGGHIYPGLAVADEFRALCDERGVQLKIHWIGNSKGMDADIVSKNVDGQGRRSADFFYGIPSGKLRRYLSFQNLLDIFKILAGTVKAFFLLKKIKPALLFSKGGFVSVPPCFCARLLKIPVYTHECDFTPGLATRINSKSAKKILVSYEETKKYLSAEAQKKAVVTGNPVRPVFYSADAARGLGFLGIERKQKPVLLVVGGSLGARQINALVRENLGWLCERFTVVHQMGAGNADESAAASLSPELRASYKPYAFIYAEMPDVIAASDVVLSRAGANSIWECAALGKPLVLVPLCGSGTRGDQEDNAAFFDRNDAAIVLARENANGEKLRAALSAMLDDGTRRKFSDCSMHLAGGTRPAQKIAALLCEELFS